MNDKPSINQIASLIKILREDEHISKIYGDDYGKYSDVFWDQIKHESKITDKQKKYITFLFISRKRQELYKILNSLGLKQFI